MRRLKLPAFLVAVIIIVLLSGYFNRNQLFLQIANRELAPYGWSIDCVDMDLDDQLDITIGHLCLNHPQFKAQLENVTVKWHHQGSWLTPLQDNLPEFIYVRQLDLVGLSAPGEMSLGELSYLSPEMLHLLMAQLSRASLPLSADIRHFKYRPYQHDKSYLGSLAVTPRSINLTLTDEKDHAVAHLSAANDGDAFSGRFSADIARTGAFLAAHDINLPPALANLSIQGQVNGRFGWHKGLFEMDEQLSDLSIVSPTGLNGSGPFTLSGSPSWKTQLEGAQLSVSMSAEKPLLLTIDKTLVARRLQDAGLPKQVLTITKGMDIEKLLIHPGMSFQMNLSTDKIRLQDLKIDSGNDTFPLQLQLEHLDAERAMESLKATYQLSGKLPLNRVIEGVSSPATLAISGSVNRSGKTTLLDWSKSSTLTVEGIKSDEARLSCGPTTLQWQGTMVLSQNELPLINLAVQSDVEALDAGGRVAIDRLNLNATVRGTPEEIMITGPVSTQEQTLATLTLTGKLQQPMLHLKGQDISIPHLFSAVQRLPYRLKVKRGTLDYTLSGKLNDYKRWDNNRLSLALTVHNVGGSLKHTDFNGLNYSQQFELAQGNLTPRPSNNNLTLSSFGQAALLTELSGSLSPAFVQRQFSVTLENLSGKAFGGRFAVDRVQWPWQEKQSSTAVLHLQELSLEQLIALEKSKGIVVTGKISGTLPFDYGNGSFSIDGGKLYNVGGGVIRVRDNPTVKRMKAQQNSMQLAFSALENLNYQSLTSDVTMHQGGQMLMSTSIKGHNPDLDNDVNFNLNLDYDLPGLLQSLTIAAELEQTINEKVNAKKEKR